MKTHLGKDMIFLHLKGRDKEGIINEPLDNLAASGKLP
jgi:hypothetical protein